MKAPGTGDASTPLAACLGSRIRRDGPLSVRDFMDACLNDPTHGYYRHRDVIGRGGDFVTAPEISQVFGELLGLWAYVVWQGMGAPGRVALVEIGPGRGTLMADALRAVRARTEFLKALEVVLVEPSPRLAALQRAALAAASVTVSWRSSVTQLPDGPAIVIGNEVIDALPVTQWVRRADRWLERGVTLDKDGHFAFCDLPQAARAPEVVLSHVGEGAIFEERDTASWMAALALARRTGPVAALFIDYGHQGPVVGDTMQAVRRHGYEHVLAAPGEADISALVDFTALASSARAAGLAVDGPVPQAGLLGSLGAVERTSRLMAANPTAAATMETATARLMAPNGMGSRFLALGIRTDGVGLLPGFG